jgi:bacterioferritin
MKENINLISVLNNMLVDELNSINQNVFDSKVSGSWGDETLFAEIERETFEELKQAEWLVKRIMFLEVLRTRQLTIGTGSNLGKSFEKSRHVG